MRRVRKVWVGCAVTALTVLGVVILFPPYRSYAPDTMVRSVIEEVVIPVFPVEVRPDIEWEEGSRRLWRERLPYVAFYGLESVDSQELIISAFRKRLTEAGLPGLRIGFFAKRQSNVQVPSELRHVILQR